MRAIQMDSFGGPEVLRLVTLPEPEPRPGEVLVRLAAAALNRRDVWIRRGGYPGGVVPLVLGSDGAGQVVAVGPGVDDSLEGWEVVINPSLHWGGAEAVQAPGFEILGSPRPGTYAEYVCVPASSIHTKPAGLTMLEAAALPLAALTAFRALVTQGRAQADERVLVTGAGGGVATFAVQLARYCGARVFCTTGSAAKLDLARSLGVEDGVLYTASNWVSQLVDMTEGGPDLIVDGAGGAVFSSLLEAARPGGRIITYGATLGPVPEVSLRAVFWKQLTIQGTTMGTDAEFTQMLRWADAGAFAPIVDQIFPLADAAAAHVRMEGHEAFGKIVLEMGY